MITLHRFGPHFGLPDPSLPCMKAEVLIRRYIEDKYTFDFAKGLTVSERGRLRAR